LTYKLDLDNVRINWCARGDVVDKLHTQTGLSVDHRMMAELYK